MNVRDGLMIAKTGCHVATIG